MRHNITEQVWSNLCLWGACVLFLLNGIHLSLLPSSAVNHNAFNYKWAEVLHLNINEPTIESISPQVSCIHSRMD